MPDTNTKLSKIMTSPVITAHAKDSMAVIKELFDKHNIHHIPVTDTQKQLVGIISKGDYHKILHSLTLFKSNKSEEYNNAVLQSLLVEDVMTQQLATLKTDDTVATAAAYFRENLFHAIPILDQEDKLAGIVSTFDLLSFAFNEPSS